MGKMERESGEQSTPKRQRRRADKRGRSRKQTKAKRSQGEVQQQKRTKDSLLPKIKTGTHRSSLPPEPVLKVVEPEEVCVICAKKIDLIASALVHPDGGYAHFDCVLEQLHQQRTLADDQKISYIGQGTFAVVQKLDDGSFSFIDRIVWESPQAFDAMKKFVEGQKQ
jgi:hypothetical protein